MLGRRVSAGWCWFAPVVCQLCDSCVLAVLCTCKVPREGGVESPGLTVIPEVFRAFPPKPPYVILHARASRTRNSSELVEVGTAYPHSIHSIVGHEIVEPGLESILRGPGCPIWGSGRDIPWGGGRDAPEMEITLEKERISRRKCWAPSRKRGQT